MSTTNHNQSDPAGHDDAHHRRNMRILYASVIGVTVLIAVLWAVIVPAQLNTFTVFSDQDRAGWESVQHAMDNEKEKFQHVLGNMRAAFEETSTETTVDVAASSEFEQTPALTQDDIDTLRARIEAASTKNHLDDNDNGTN